MARLQLRQTGGVCGEDAATVQWRRLGAACALTVLLTASGAADGNAQALRVVDADAAGAVKLTTSTTATSLRLPLELDSGRVSGLTVAVDDFIAPNGARIQPVVMLNGKPADRPIDVEPKDRPVLEVAASFPIAGDYTSNLVLFQAGAHVRSVHLAVTRLRSEVSAQVEGLETVATIKWLDADARIRFAVRETSGQQIMLYPPALDDFARKESDKVRTQARYETIEVGCQPPTAPPHAPAPRTPPPGGPLVVEPMAEQHCEIEVRAIADAGEYSGTLRLASADGKPVTKEVTVLVKTSGWVAALWVFLGAAASFTIRRYTKEQRPRLQALRRLRYAQTDLERVEREAGSPAAPAPAVLVGLRSQLSTVERDLDDGTAADGAGAILAELEEKIRQLPGWLTTGRKLDAVAPAEIVKAPRGEWVQLADSYFLKAGTKVDATADLVKIDASIKDAVVASIDGYVKTIETYASAHPGKKQQIGEISILLAKVKQAAGAEDWKAVTQDYRMARLQYAQVLADELETIVKAPQPPLGLDAKSWEALRDDITRQLASIRQETNPERAVEGYRGASRTYLDVVAGKLDTMVGSLLGQGRSAEKAKLEEARTALIDTRLAAQRDDLEQARAQYEHTAQVVSSVLEDRQKAGGAGQGVVGVQTVASLGGAVPEGNVRSFEAVGQLPAARAYNTAQQLSDALQRYDLLLNSALLLIACMVGVSLLWAPDPVWGGWKSCTTALLWGLGLHQVAGSALDGLPAVTRKILG